MIQSWKVYLYKWAQLEWNIIQGNMGMVVHWHGPVASGRSSTPPYDDAYVSTISNFNILEIILLIN